MITPWRLPSRDANDADHLAILLLAGGILSFTSKESVGLLPYAWKVLGSVSVVTAPLLWVRLPHMKWGGVIAAVILGSIPLVRSAHQAMEGRDALGVLGALVIGYWFFRIDYRHRWADAGS